jgi:hypothetical protein
VYDSVKPYTCRFDTEGKFPYTNIENIKQEVSITNLRPTLEQSPDSFTWNRNGFKVITIPNMMTYEDFNDDDTVRAKHIPRILLALQQELGASNIHVLDYRVSEDCATSWAGLSNASTENENPISQSAPKKNTSISSHQAEYTLVDHFVLPSLLSADSLEITRWRQFVKR